MRCPSTFATLPAHETKNRVQASITVHFCSFSRLWCRAMPCCAVLFRAVLCRAVLYRAVPFRAHPRCAVECSILVMVVVVSLVFDGSTRRSIYTGQVAHAEPAPGGRRDPQVPLHHPFPFHRHHRGGFWSRLQVRQPSFLSNLGTREFVSAYFSSLLRRVARSYRPQQQN